MTDHPPVRKHALPVVLGIAAVCAVAGVVIWQAGMASRRTPAVHRPTTVRIAYSKKGDYLPMIVALKQNLFVPHGITVEEKTVTGGIEAAEAVNTGAADIGMMGEVPATIAAARGSAVILAAYSVDERKHRVIVAPGVSISAPKDLEGKRFAVQHGSSTFGGFLMYCDAHGVDVRKITMVKMNPRDMPEAMAGGQIDAMAGSEPWPSNVLKSNPKAREFAVLSGLGCNYPMVMVASRSFAQAHPDDVTRVLEAFRDAIGSVAEHPRDAANAMAVQSGLEPEAELRDLQRVTWGLTLDDVTVNGLKKMARFLREQKVIDHEPDWAQAIAPQYLNALPKDATRGR